MQKKTIIFVLSLLLCISSWAQQTNILNSVSPKLRQFIIDHPAASKLLTDTLSEAFSNRVVQIYYFYSDDKSLPGSYHYYPSESAVGICILESQQPVDEFSSFIFEALNSEGEKHFQELSYKAQSGNISRTNYATEIMRVEFAAVKRTQNLLGNLKLNEKEISGSHLYKHFLECPSKFEDFLIYTKKISLPERDSIKEYEAQYDLLRRSQ
jgi:hypothetical protein